MLVCVALDALVALCWFGCPVLYALVWLAARVLLCRLERFARLCYFGTVFWDVARKSCAKRFVLGMESRAREFLCQEKDVGVAQGCRARAKSLQTFERR